MSVLDVRCQRCPCQFQDQQTGRVFTDNQPMELVAQFGVRGAKTLEYRCMSCSGKANMQQRRNPHTGRPQWCQVRLTGSDEEYRPNSIKPGEQVQIPVAYTIGSSAVTARRVPVGPPPTIPVAFSLDPRIGSDAQIQANDPMHPHNLRKRMQPWRLDQLT